MKNLPYLYIDNELDFNAIVLLLILNKLSHNSKNNLKLDFNKLQIFLYLIRNPEKINEILIGSGKNTAFISEKHTHTATSLSTNVDILHDRKKLRVLLQRLSSNGLLGAEKDDSNEIKYFTTGKGASLSDSLNNNYFKTVDNHLNFLKPLLSLKTSKLLSLINNSLNGY